MMSSQREPIKHILKFMSVELCDAVYEGRKLFEIRLNDRDYRVDDIIQPVSIDESGCRINHPIDNVRYRITYIITEWPDALKEGYCVFGMQAI